MLFPLVCIARVDRLIEAVRYGQPRARVAQNRPDHVRAGPAAGLSGHPARRDPEIRRVAGVALRMRRGEGQGAIIPAGRSCAAANTRLLRKRPFRSFVMAIGSVFRGFGLRGVRSFAEKGIGGTGKGLGPRVQ